jgi:pseudaminic acid cytidylyltransferase
MTSVAIIPARGGSKRIPKKNIRNLGGKPAIAYPIELALSAKIFERVIVTTDDVEIADVSREYGAEVPFIRKPELSDDFALTIDVISDAVRQLRQMGGIFDYVCCLYPVTPLLKPQRIVQSLEILQEGNWDYVFPAIEFPSPIERGFKKSKSGQIEFRFPEFAHSRTQDIGKTFHDAGQFYYGRADAWLDKKPVLVGNSTFLELDKNETVDIDDLEDWAFVEQLFILNSRIVDELDDNC